MHFQMREWHSVACGAPSLSHMPRTGREDGHQKQSKRIKARLKALPLSIDGLASFVVEDLSHFDNSLLCMQRWGRGVGESGLTT